MKRDADWISMFGCDELEPLSRTVPALPMDDPLWLEHVTGGRSAEHVLDESFVKEISGCETVFGSGTAQPRTTITGLTEFAKRAKGLTRQQIADRMTKYYSHGVWRGWEKMMDTFIGTAESEFDERGARSFLEVA
jgi:hypothetical protein